LESSLEFHEANIIMSQLITLPSSSNPSDGTPLLHRVDQAIQNSPVSRPFLLETREGAVVIRGTVNSYFEKQMVQEALRTVEGITEILNELDVVYPKPRCR
jgi:hypothetical protein